MEPQVELEMTPATGQTKLGTEVREVLQQTPNPAAQWPSALPPAEVHSADPGLGVAVDVGEP